LLYSFQMPRCQCLKLNGQQCTRNGDPSYSNQLYCYQHQNCSQPVNHPQEPQIPIIAKLPLKNENPLFNFSGSLDSVTGLPTGSGTLTFFLNGEFLGRKYSQGNILSGHFTQGKLDGYGIVHNDHGVYKGNLLGSLANGEGVWTLPNGEIYTGHFIKGRREGSGKYKYMNGDIYEGQWNEGLRHGQGKQIFTNGDIYEGKWVFDDLHTATLQSSKGFVFVGQINKFDPIKGKITYPNGNTYEGEIAKLKPNGQGKLVEKNKSTYIGQFQNGLFTGIGQMIASTGDQFIGEFKNWKLTKGQLKSPLGFNYNGFFKNYQMHGQGEIKFHLNGVIFKGQFNDNKLEKGSWTDLPKNIVASQLESKTPSEIIAIIKPSATLSGFKKIKKVTSKIKAKSMKLNLGFANQNVSEWQKICQQLNKEYGLPQLQSIAKTYDIDQTLPKKKLCQLIALEVEKCTNDTDLISDEISEQEPNVFHYRDPKTQVNYCFTENDAPYFKDKNLNPYNKQPLDAQTYAQIKAFMKLPVQNLVVTPAMNAIFDQSGLDFDFEQRKQFVFLVQMTNTFPEFKARPDNTFPITVNNQAEWLLLYTQIMSLL
jgi:hypothetical protein